MDADYRIGDRGPAVAEIIAKLARLDLLDGHPGATEFDRGCDRAVREFQQRRGLLVDGVVGTETYRALDEATWRLGDRPLSHRVSSPFVGDDVAALQQRLLDLGFDPGRCDGIYGRATDAAVRDFQRNVGLGDDGTCGPQTLAALVRLSRAVVGGSPAALRATELLHRAGRGLAGKVVVLDPGHGGEDPGVTAAGLQEAAVVADIAARLEGRLAAGGVRVALTHGPDRNPTDLERAAFANAMGADLFVSLHVDGDRTATASGAASYYYGSGSGPGTASVIGARFAALVQRELVARTGLADARSHPKTWDLLRRTSMPAVRIECGYLTSPLDAARLAEPDFRDAVAQSVLVAVQRLYLPPDHDVPTGTLVLPGDLLDAEA